MSQDQSELAQELVEELQPVYSVFKGSTLKCIWPTKTERNLREDDAADLGLKNRTQRFFDRKNGMYGLEFSLYEWAGLGTEDQSRGANAPTDMLDKHRLSDHRIETVPEFGQYKLERNPLTADVTVTVQLIDSDTFKVREWELDFLLPKLWEAGFKDCDATRRRKKKEGEAAPQKTPTQILDEYIWNNATI